MHFVVLLVKGDSAFEMQLNSFFEYLTIQNMQLHFMMKQINNIIHSLKLNPCLLVSSVLPSIPD